ncbi:MAG: N-6 DNA methylase [Cyanobacteria bacterium REEB417]|nr:N-6 DNA methylase [Cyanobacteria bacterium REEB417]
MSGTFYAPAALLRALEGRQAYDPAAGTGGFLLQTREALADQPEFRNPPFALQGERA